MLASPEVGFIVPTKAMTRSGQKSVTTANPAPVAAISTAAAMSSKQRVCRLAIHPTHSVKSADRERVVSEFDKVDRKQQGDIASPNARTPRAARTRNASFEASGGNGRHHS